MYDDSVKMYDHFSNVASLYNDIRTTDLEPVSFIKEKLKDRKEIRSADIGCGAGRYDLLFFQNLNNLHLICTDINQSMIEQTSDLLKNNGIKSYQTMVSSIDSLSLEENSLDCVVTFNAVHHFSFANFLEKSASFLKEDGFIFVYTRLQSQNANNIWGRHFPQFVDNEDRLYELDDLGKWVDSVDSVMVESIDRFRYRRHSTLRELLKQASCKHYSTFCL